MNEPLRTNTQPPQVQTARNSSKNTLFFNEAIIPKNSVTFQQ